MSNRNLAIFAGMFVAVIVAGFLGAFEVSTGVILKAAVLGVSTGLMAVGLVLLYRTTRVINFSYGAMGTLAGSLATGLFLGKAGISWWLAVPIGIAAGVVLGVLTEILIIRRFANSPRLVLTVATIGLAQAFGGLALYVPKWLGDNPINPGFKTPVSDDPGDPTWNIEPVVINGNEMLMVAVVPVVLVGLVWFLFRTEAGTAVRGMAENLDRARLLGIPVNKLNVLLWGIAGGLAATTVILRAPTQGLQIDAASGPTTLLAPMAAAVIVGMRSIPGAFAAGIGVEVIDQLVQANTSDDFVRSWTYPILLGIILVALMLQEKPKGRAGDAGDSWSAAGVAHKLPKALNSLPEVRGLRIAGAALVAAALVWIPMRGSDTQINTATIALIFGMVAVSIVVLTGWGGVVSLGQVALVGIGGIAAANMFADYQLDLFITIAISAVVSGIIAALIGIPALRVSGQLLAVTTLAFAVATQLHFFNQSNYPEYITGDYTRPQLWGSIDVTEGTLYVLCLVILAIAVFVAHNLRRARTGRAVIATRDNEKSAAAAGINTTETKIAAFVFSGMFAGVAGALHASALPVGNNSYPAITSILVFSMAVIGGVASLGGALGGVALIQWLGYLRPQLQLALSGVGLLVILLFIPGGLAQAYERLRDRIAHAAGRRRGIQLVERFETVDMSEPTPVPTPHIEGAEPVEVSPSGNGVDATSRVSSSETAAAKFGLATSTGSGATLLSCDGVESGYGSLQVLFGIDSYTHDGETLALLGTNGAGKSTLFKAIVGLLPVWKGKVVFDGTDITKMPTEKIARLGLSMMPGGKGIFPTLTVAENLKLSTWMLRGDKATARQRMEEMLEMFPILRDRDDQQAGNLSGGEQQQLSIAMAFITDPKMVLIDELSLGLAPTIVGMLVDKVKQLHGQGTTIVVVEQSLNVALMMCENAVFLEKGQVRFRGPTGGLLDRPDILRAVFIGGGDGDDAGAAPMLEAPPDQRPTRGVTLECVSLNKRFGGITAVHDVNLTVDPAHIVGLIGHNGAGKTTLFDVLTGFLESNGGRVLLNGTDITGHPPHKRAIMEVGRSFQEARLYPSLTVFECIKVALERHLANRDPVAAALRLPASTDSEKSADKRVEELIELLGLDAFRDRPTGELSTGTRRIVELGCLLAQDPAVILLDEPTAGVAQAETENFPPLLRRIQAETGAAMVVIEHDMALLSKLCDHFVALEQGAVIARGTPEEVLADPAVIASYLGTNEDVAHRSGDRRTTAATEPDDAGPTAATAVIDREESET